MNENNQITRIGSAALALVVIILGFSFIRGNLESPRPYSLEASHVSDPADTRKVESRLWQDPFEPFESATNQPAAPKSETDSSAGDPLWSFQAKAKDFNLKFEIGQSASKMPPEDPSFWNDLARRAKNPATPIAILGVMLEGGSFPEDKEVRLRLRYAVEVALSTSELGPEDRTHISTNTVFLTRKGIDEYERPSRFAYEWFKTRNNVNKFQICVLWLNENDFADDPASRLTSLLVKVPALTNAAKKVSFYLIGPRSSDTLRNLALVGLTNTSSFSHLRKAADIGRFRILSPEATAAVNDTGLGDSEGAKVRSALTARFGNHVFYNWIATDQKLAGLIARELTNRMSRTLLACPHNAVVLLSEQDTYFGSTLADEWTDALVTNGVCKSAGHVWQFAYLRGLDGSKPQTKTPAQPAVLATTPEAALQTVMEQQQTGEKADGNAQMDYIARLGEFLKRKDQEIKEQGCGRIVAVGLTGSDAYDKLNLLRELRPQLPEAVFFTVDLDAPLWTTKELRYTRNLLVGSAYPLESQFEFSQPHPDEFAPFRDVYQTAVCRACYGVVVNQILGGTNGLMADSTNLAGGIYEIGRSGPVRLLPVDQAKPEPKPESANSRQPYLFVGLVTLGASTIFLVAAFYYGFRRPEENQLIRLELILKAEKKERRRQIPTYWLLLGCLGALVIGLVGLVLYSYARGIASEPGEEPWTFSEGVSIWPSEGIRGLVLIGAVIFLIVAYYRRQRHRRKLWEKYFRSPQDAGKDWPEVWKNEYKKRWKLDLSAELDYKVKLVQADAEELWNLAGAKEEKKPEYIIFAQARLEQEREANLIFGWLPPFVENQKIRIGKACVDAAALFRAYLRLGQFINRFRRVVQYLGVYGIVMGSMIWYFQGLPTYLNIRGTASHNFDSAMLALVIALTLFVLFYVLDAAFLTKRLLDYISRHPTSWPDRTLEKRAEKHGVRPEHLDGLLDVDFAAVQTQEIGPLMLGPILLTLMLALSLSTWLDNWTWSPGLVLIITTNLGAVVICWWVVRRAADKVRKYALRQLARYKNAVKKSGSALVNVPNAGGQTPSAQETYLSQLEAVRKTILEEDRGAYAHWFQDPTYLAVFIPSSISGIITLIGSLWLSK